MSSAVLRRTTTTECSDIARATRRTILRIAATAACTLTIPTNVRTNVGTATTGAGNLGFLNERALLWRARFFYAFKRFRV